jgi:hypothetical protein
VNCPTCGATVPVLEGYVTWCHECGWNVTAPPRPDLRAGRLEPRLTPSKLAAYALAAFV